MGKNTLGKVLLWLNSRENCWAFKAPRFSQFPPSLPSCRPPPLLNPAPVTHPSTHPHSYLALYIVPVFWMKKSIVLKQVIQMFKWQSSERKTKTNKGCGKFPTFFFFNKIWRPRQVVLEKGQKYLRDLDFLDFYFTGVALLPFVDEKRLLSALSEVYSDLTESESKLYFIIHRIFNCANITLL